MTLNAKQFDTGRSFVFNIMDNDEPFDLTGCSAYLRIAKADGTQFQGSECCIINGASITVDASIGNGDQILSASGINKCELHIKDGNDIGITTWNFNIYVEARVHNSENLSSVDSYDILDIAMQAEQTRAENEAIRNKNEEGRMANENQRMEAENIRGINEDQRIADDNAREESEQIRVQNEAERQKTFGAVLSQAQAYVTTASISAFNAKNSEDKAKASEDAAAASEDAAATSEENAEISATLASDSAAAASASQNAAAASEIVTVQKAADASDSADAAGASKTAAETAEANAEAQANISKSYAVGTDNAVRPNDATDNSAFYAALAQQLTDQAQLLLDQAQRIVSAATQGALIACGTVAFANLPETAETGHMYNISDDFTTDSRFAEGTGIYYRAGANVYWTADGKWDILVGTQVTGVKGGAEMEYRVGNVNITAANIGLGNVPNVATNDQTPTFEQASLRVNIASGERLSTIFGKIKKWFADLKSVAFSGSYNDLSDRPDLKTVATSGSYNDLNNKPAIPIIPTSLPANGGNADTVDGKHAADLQNYNNLANRPAIPDVSGKLDKSGGTMSGNLEFANSGTALRGIQGTMGDNDQWRVMGGATASNAGYLEIATSDDASEPIYVRQYNSGVFGTLQRTATLLDASGNTQFPGTVTAGNGFSGTLTRTLTTKEQIAANTDANNIAGAVAVKDMFNQLNSDLSNVLQIKVVLNNNNANDTYVPGIYTTTPETIGASDWGLLIIIPDYWQAWFYQIWLLANGAIKFRKNINAEGWRSWKTIQMS